MRSGHCWLAARLSSSTACLALWSILPGVPKDVALYDLTPLRRTLERLVDFDRLNAGEVRFTVAAVDIEV